MAVSDLRLCIVEVVCVDSRLSQFQMKTKDTKHTGQFLVFSSQLFFDVSQLFILMSQFLQFHGLLSGISLGCLEQHRDLFDLTLEFNVGSLKGSASLLQLLGMSGRLFQVHDEYFHFALQSGLLLLKSCTLCQESFQLLLVLCNLSLQLSSKKGLKPMTQYRVDSPKFLDLFVMGLDLDLVLGSPSGGLSVGL